MIKKHWKLLILTSIITLLPILAGIILWEQLPQQLPIHWNTNGEADGWSSKSFAVFGLPPLLLFIQWIGVFAIVADPKKKNHSDKVLHLSFWIVPVLSMMSAATIYVTAIGKELMVGAIAPVFLGLLFVIIGNYLPKCKQNYTIGIKIPWTLNSEENWNKTHRVAGWVFVIGGFVVIAAGFCKIGWLILPLVLLMVLVPLVYSFLLHRKGI